MAYRGRFFIRLREYICGDHVETEIYPVFQQPGKRRAKCKPSTEVRIRQNKRDRERKLVRILRLNFHKGDYALHLTYGQKPANLEEAMRHLSNFIACLRRRYRKAGVELKYVHTTEYGSKSGRVHHHLVINGGIDRDEIESLWRHGYANCDRLQFDDGLEALAKYLCEDPATYRAWTPSRNLQMPEPSIRDGAVSLETVKEITCAVDEKNAEQLFESIYPGYDCISVEYDKNECNGGIYIRAQLCRKESEHAVKRQKMQPPCAKGVFGRGENGEVV